MQEENTVFTLMDLHNHFTTKSKVIDPKRALLVIQSTLGPYGVCGVTNFLDRRYEAFADEISKSRQNVKDISNALYIPTVSQDKGILIVKVEEVPTDLGDILVVGLPREVHLKPKMRLEETLDQAKKLGALTGIAHMFMGKIGKYLSASEEVRERILKQVDLIETHNGSNPYWLNRKAVEFYKREIVGSKYRQVGKVSFSDGHSYNEVGSSNTAINFPDNYSLLNTPEKVVAALRKGICSNKNNHNTTSKHSILGAGVHAGILVNMILLSKLGINVSHGDKEAIYPLNK